MQCDRCKEDQKRFNWLWSSCHICVAMNQSIRVDDAEGKLMFEFSLWALKEFWKGAGRKAEDFWVPLNEKEALDLVVLAGLLEPEERAEVKVKLYTPNDWKPIPTHIELFQRDEKGEYVREAPKEVSQEKKQGKETTKERLRRKLALKRREKAPENPKQIEFGEPSKFPSIIERGDPRDVPCNKLVPLSLNLNDPDVQQEQALRRARAERGSQFW